MTTPTDKQAYMIELDDEIKKFLNAVLISQTKKLSLKIQRSTLKNTIDTYKENMRAINRKYHQAEELHVNIPRENKKSW